MQQTNQLQFRVTLFSCLPRI